MKHWFVWLLPAAVACAAVYNGVPCSSIGYLCATIAVFFGVSAAVPRVATLLSVDLPLDDPARYLRTFKFVQHILVTCVTLPYLGADWVAAIGTSSAVLDFLHGWQFWSWVIFATIDPFVHDSSTKFFLMYAVHHAVTLTLISVASSYGLTCVGAAVMATTESTDVLYSLLKLGVLSDKPSVPFQTVVFAAFALLWLLLRVIGFTTLIFKPLLFADSTPDVPVLGVVCCAVLLLMNVVWGAKIAHAGAMLARGKPVNDVNVAIMHTKQVA